MKNGWIATAGIVALAFALAFSFSGQMPQNIAVHWGLEGNANGYAQKDFGMYFVPVLMVAVALVLYAFPKIDPKRKNIEKFWGNYCWFVAAIEAFLLYLQILTVGWNIGFSFNMGQMLAPGFAFLMYCTGEIISKAKPNWTIGIRTPWTLSSENVWAKTHALGGKLFKLCAALSLLGALLPKYAILLLVAPVLLAAVYLFIYSYLEYSKERKRK